VENTSLSLRGEVWDHTNSLTLTLSIEVLVPNPKSNWLCFCASVVSILSILEVLNWISKRFDSVILFVLFSKYQNFQYYEKLKYT
jgi:hypothetical protein